MSRPSGLPPRVYAKGRWYYLVTAEGSKRIWTKLTPIRAGLSPLYRKLADLAAREVAPDRMPVLVVDWQAEVMPEHAAKTQENDRWATAAIGEAFAEFRAGEVTTPDCVAFLKPYRDRPRTHNLMRSTLRELMRFAELKGYRPPGSNPLQAVSAMQTPARDRYPTDSEVRRLKFHAMVGRPDRWGNRTFARSGPMVAAAIDLAYLTGQRIGDLLDLRWSRRAALNEAGEAVAPYIAAEGIYFKPSKTEKTTGAKVLITWTPRLRAVIARIEATGRRNMRHVLTNQEAQPLLYSTFATAWWRACDRAGIKGLHFHDLRAKALTDTAKKHGKKAAQAKGAHSTERQTDDYLRAMEAQKSESTR